MRLRPLPRFVRVSYTPALLLAAVAWHWLSRFHDIVSIAGIGALVMVALVPLPALLSTPDRFVERVGQAVAGVPVVGGLLFGTYLAFVPHGVGVPGEPAAIATASGLDCLLGNYAASACPHLGGGLAFLLVSLAIGYLVYARAAGYLLAVAGICAVVGAWLGWENNLAQLLLVSAVLFAVGALVMDPEVVTERLRDALDGRFARQ